MAGQSACLWTVLRCREPDFQQCFGVTSEAAAAAVVKQRCRIVSRKDLDRDPAALALWHEEIRKPFLQYQQQPHHKQDQEM